MNKIVCITILSLLLVSTVIAVPPTFTEVTGQSCGKYITIQGVNRVWYNNDRSCTCSGSWNKIPIWYGSDFTMAFTCKK